MSGKEFHIRGADFFAFPIYYKNRTCIAYCECMQSRESHAFGNKEVWCTVAHRTRRRGSSRIYVTWLTTMSKSKSLLLIPCKLSIRVFIRIRFCCGFSCFTPVDLTGKVHMMWELALGGMELGTPNALTPTPSKHAECSERMSSVSCYEMLIQMCFVFR